MVEIELTEQEVEALLDEVKTLLETVIGDIGEIFWQYLRLLDRLFEYGYSTAREGTGFGLAIAQEIVQAHDWSIRVTESEASGARFEITGVEFVQ